jgi:hypothetical protein
MWTFQGFGVYDLDRGRLCLPAGISNYVSWVTLGEAVECLAVPLPGRLGGIAVFPPAALAEHRELMTGWSKRDPQPGDMGTAAYELARTGMVTWSAKIGKDGRFTLPLGARELGILPIADNAQVALVAFRDVFEVWNPSDLRERIHEAAGRWAELKAQGLPGLLSP